MMSRIFGASCKSAQRVIVKFLLDFKAGIIIALKYPPRLQSALKKEAYYFFVIRN